MSVSVSVSRGGTVGNGLSVPNISEQIRTPISINK